MSGADEFAEAFTQWAQSEGLLPRITQEQCADLAKAFGAGYLYALKTRAGAAEARRPAGEAAAGKDGPEDEWCCQACKAAARTHGDMSPAGKDGKR